MSAAYWENRRVALGKMAEVAHILLHIGMVTHGNRVTARVRRELCRCNDNFKQGQRSGVLPDYGGPY